MYFFNKLLHQTILKYLQLGRIMSSMLRKWVVMNPLRNLGESYHHTSIFLAEKQEILKLPTHGHEIHHEIELGFMIGKEGKNIEKQDWQDYVGGYFLALDLTDRDMQAHFKKQGFPWDLAKGQDNFFPISKFIPKEKVIDPYNLKLELRINDKIVQQDIVTAQFHFTKPLLFCKK